jgi:acylphosphatase
MSKTRAHVFVSGRVQGVFFRQNTNRQAQIHNVAGWVRNLEDGRVEAVFEGEEASINALLAFCSRGPKGASVTDVVVTWETFKGESENFRIIY